MEGNGTRRAVVTGLGLVTPLGIGIEENWTALMEGRCGIGEITRFDASAFTCRIAAEVKNFRGEDYLPKKLLRNLDPFLKYALAAADIGVEDAGLKVAPEEAEKAGVVLGCGLGGLSTIEQGYEIYTRTGPRKVTPFFIPMVISNMAPGLISINHGAKGPNLSLQTACAAGTHAVGQAFHMIRSGMCDIMITGGIESTITPLAVAGFASMKALSTRNDEPLKASRPFERDRDGFILGEGAAIIILEELTRARERGAKIYGEVVGFGLTGDAHHMTAPPPGGEGAQRCMRMALRDAGVEPEAIDYINAHGTSTELNDRYETQAIKAVFGERAYKIPVSSTKSMTGHLLGAAGGIEAAYTALTLQREMIPPTINYENPDPQCDLDYVPNTPRAAKPEIALSNSFGFGGTNGTLVIRKWMGE